VCGVCLNFHPFFFLLWFLCQVFSLHSFIYWMHMGGFQEHGTLIKSVFWDTSTSRYIMPYLSAYILHSLHTLFASRCHLPMSYMLPEAIPEAVPEICYCIRRAPCNCKYAS
jgi:hypothetical protein